MHVTEIHSLINSSNADHQLFPQTYLYQIEFTLKYVGRRNSCAAFIPNVFDAFS